MIDAGSFRDPDSRVFTADGRILRGLSGHGAAVDEEVRGTGLMADLVGRRLFVENDRVEFTAPQGVPDQAVVESRRIGVISHPGEWSFGMLRDAALVTLDANLVALERGYILKDASGFNVTFDGSAPVIIDVSSLERFAGLWNGYGQFCDHFLAPLLLEAYGGVPFQPVLRTSTTGFPIVALAGLLRGTGRWRKGVPTHVRMRARAERRAGAAATADRSRYREVTLPAAAVANTMRSMRRLVAGLDSGASSVWSRYETELPYTGDEAEAKQRFVAGAAAAAAAGDDRLALDVGGNAGMYSRILGDRFRSVVAIDVDPGSVDRMYAARLPGVTPLVVDVANPTPAFGWRGRERLSFQDRVRPTFGSWLAVVHHLCLGQGIPLPATVDLIAATAPESVVELVHENDPMVARITASRRGRHQPYSLALFESAASESMVVRDRLQVTSTRTLFHLTRS